MRASRRVSTVGSEWICCLHFSPPPTAAAAVCSQAKKGFLLLFPLLRSFRFATAAAADISREEKEFLPKVCGRQDDVCGTNNNRCLALFCRRSLPNRLRRMQEIGN